jgi:outer membrane protein TolC
MRPILPLVILASVSPAATADKLEAQPMSLPDLFKIAVRTAPALEHVGFEIAHLDAAVMTARAPENFTLKANFNFNRIRGAPIPPSTAGSATDVLTADFGLSRLLPTNGTLELIGIATQTNSDFSGVSAEFVTSSLRLRLTQPLLKGFGPAVQRKAIIKSTFAREAAMLRIQTNASAFAATMIDAYYRLSLAWNVLEVRRIGYDLVLKQKKLTDAGVRTGKLSTSETIPVDAALASREQDLLTAELDVIVRSLELRKLAGLDLPLDQIAIKTDALPKLETRDPDLAQFVKLAIANSHEIAAARIGARASDAAVKAAKRDLLPKLDLRLEGGPLGTDSKLAASFDRLRERAGYNFLANLSFELPLGRDAVKATHLDERANRASAHHEVIEIQMNLSSEVAKTVYEVRAFRARAALGDKTIALAQANVNAEQRKFELGKTTNNEILRLQEELENARLRQASAIAEWAIARAKLEAQSGTLLNKIGIKVRTSGFDLDDYTHGKGSGEHHEHDGHDH